MDEDALKKQYSRDDFPRGDQLKHRDAPQPGDPSTRLRSNDSSDAFYRNQKMLIPKQNDENYLGY